MHYLMWHYPISCWNNHTIFLIASSPPYPIKSDHPSNLKCITNFRSNLYTHSCFMFSYHEDIVPNNWNINGSCNKVVYLSQCEPNSAWIGRRSEGEGDGDSTHSLNFLGTAQLCRLSSLRGSWLGSTYWQDHVSSYERRSRAYASQCQSDLGIARCNFVIRTMYIN